MQDIPERPDQIGAEWLEGALAEQFPGVRVASLTCSDLAQGTNQNARIQVEYKESAGAPRHIFAFLGLRTSWVRSNGGVVSSYDSAPRSSHILAHDSK